VPPPAHRAHATGRRRMGCAHALAHVHPHADPPLWRALEVADGTPTARGPSRPDGGGGVRAGETCFAL